LRLTTKSSSIVEKKNNIVHPKSNECFFISSFSQALLLRGIGPSLLAKSHNCNNYNKFIIFGSATKQRAFKYLNK
jgi:hypothetical protein